MNKQAVTTHASSEGAPSTKVPQRRCALCRQEGEKHQFLSFFLDETQRCLEWKSAGQQGRGLSICVNKSCLERASSRWILKPADVLDGSVFLNLVVNKLTKDVLEALGAARRQKKLIVGVRPLGHKLNVQAKQFQSAGEVAGMWVLWAQDASPGSRKGIQHCLDKHSSSMRVAVLPISKETLGHALGQLEVSVVGLWASQTVRGFADKVALIQGESGLP